MKTVDSSRIDILAGLSTAKSQRIVPDSPVEEAGFELFVPLGISASWHARGGFIRRGTNRRYGAGSETWQLRRCIFQDYETAVNCVRQAAEQGEYQAQSQLGACTR